MDAFTEPAHSKTHHAKDAVEMQQYLSEFL
jgi:hypothetical protein